MFTLCFIIGVSVFSLAYENIALNKPAYQTFPNTKYSDRYVQAGNAVDGRKSVLGLWGQQCAISDDLKQTATWWVNLTSILSIHNITIYYFTDNAKWGPSNIYPSRFLGFSLYVSNTTNTSEGTLCFKDTNFNLTTIPAVFNTTCFTHGQYVIYYNERLAGVMYPDGYSSSAYNELCEVEVYGCPVPGYYGSNCSTPCPDLNCRYCHIETGTCQGCNTGFQGNRCELVCGNYTYGEECGETCGSCLDSLPCHHINGTCVNGCGPGFTGVNCDKECESGHYGDRCTQECSIFCSQSRDCDHVTGSCRGGCKSGWQGHDCLHVEELTATNHNAVLYGVYGISVTSLLLIGILFIYIIVLRKSKRHFQGLCDSKEYPEQLQARESDKSKQESMNNGYQELELTNTQLAYETLK